MTAAQATSRSIYLNVIFVWKLINDNFFVFFSLFFSLRRSCATRWVVVVVAVMIVVVVPIASRADPYHTIVFAYECPKFHAVNMDIQSSCLQFSLLANVCSMDNITLTMIIMMFLIFVFLCGPKEFCFR